MPLWSWIKCRVWRRHDEKVLCGPDGLYLQCVRCGSRSSGWAIARKAPLPAPIVRIHPATVPPVAQPVEVPRVIPFDRTSGARRLIKSNSDTRVPRVRRLGADEETALLSAAQALPRGVGPRLHAVIVAALETGCQRSELLSLQWKDVDLEQREIEIRSSRSGADLSRRIPISARLAGVLSALPAARARHPEARVFRGSAAGGVRRGWDTAVLRAYGHEPEWRGNSLAPASRAQLQAIDLQFRDLRVEAAARWQAAGWPRQHVRAMLGRDLSQTDTLRNAARMGLHELMRRYDESRDTPRTRMAKADLRPSVEEPKQQSPMDSRR
jgi:integrase